MKIKDSTLGDDEKGFQALANKKARENGTLPAKAPPPTTNSMQTALASIAKPKQSFADGGTAIDMSSILPPDLSLSGGAPIVPSADQFDVNSVASPSAPIHTNGITPADSPGLDMQMVKDLIAQKQAQAAPAPMAPAPAPMAPAAPHPMTQAAQALQSTPDTDPGIYQGMTSADRLAMQQKLMQQQNSPMGLLGKGLAGLGDAVNNSYGNGHSTFAKDNQANMDNKQAQALSGIDTAREQKLQDIQGPMAAQMADPKSPLAMSMRKTLQSAGLKVPSGMSPTVMLQISGPLGELAMKQATLAVQQQSANAAQANAGAERRIAAAKDLGDRGIIRKGLDMFDATKSPETQVLQDELHETNGRPAAQPAPHGIPDLGGTFNGHKVLSVKRIS